MDDPSLPRFMTVQQVCEYLQLSKSSVYTLIATGRLPSYRFGVKGGAQRVASADLLAYLASIRRGPPIETPPPPAYEPTLAKPRRMGTKNNRKRPEA